MRAKHTKTDWYLLGAVLPIAFFPVAFILLQSGRMGSFLPIMALIVLPVIGITCCVQGFRKSSNAWIQTVSLLVGVLYLLPLLVLAFFLSGPLQD